MPQMSPMYWLLLMFYFMIILTFISFSFLMKPMTKLVHCSKFNFNWKW